MTQNISYVLYPDGLGFCAKSENGNLGEIIFLHSGGDKLVIEHTSIVKSPDSEIDFSSDSVCVNLVRRVCNLARAQHKKILTMCPVARSVLNKFSEFDDVRLMNCH